VSASPSQSPIPCVWTGQVFEPLRSFRRKAAEAYGAGEIVNLAPVEDRSAASHRHYFAAINEAWHSLNEEQTAQWPSPEHLRKACLIRAGYRDERSVVCGSKANAEHVAAFIRPMDDYAIVSVSGTTVVVLTAKSQSMRAMGKQAFTESKEAVLNVLADLLGVDVGAIPHTAAA